MNIYGPILVLGIGLFLFLYSIKFRVPRFILTLIAAIMVFNVIGTVIISVTQTGTIVYSISLPFIGIFVTREGIDLAILVFLRSLAGLFVVLFFATSTPVPHLFNSLKNFGLPSYIAEITVLIYRYSFLIIEQSEQMLNAADCRMGFSGRTKYLRTIGTLAANILIRSLESVERSGKALQSRNFTGVFPVFKEPNKITVPWIILSIATLATIFLIGNIR
jgi:cobalt ECF transporter T component CbiQ